MINRFEFEHMSESCHGGGVAQVLLGRDVWRNWCMEETVQLRRTSFGHIGTLEPL